MWVTQYPFPEGLQSVENCQPRGPSWFHLETDATCFPPFVLGLHLTDENVCLVEGGFAAHASHDVEQDPWCGGCSTPSQAPLTTPHHPSPKFPAALVCRFHIQRRESIFRTVEEIRKQCLQPLMMDVSKALLLTPPPPFSP